MVAECQGGGDFLIKLFGKTIPVPEPEPESGDAKVGRLACCFSLFPAESAASECHFFFACEKKTLRPRIMLRLKGVSSRLR
jgi:hypothetical protein